jgi:hypothetical protein
MLCRQSEDDIAVFNGDSMWRDDQTAVGLPSEL